MAFPFFYSPPASTGIYTLSLHDALPISVMLLALPRAPPPAALRVAQSCRALARSDRKSTRLNSSHPSISYAVFCLKKKKKSYYSITVFVPFTGTQAFKNGNNIFSKNHHG